MDVVNARVTANEAKGARSDGIIAALLCFAVGLTLLLTGFNDRSSDQAVVRVRDKPAHVVKAQGPTTDEFQQRVVMQLAGGVAMLIIGAGMLYFTCRSSLGRQPSPDDDV